MKIKILQRVSFLEFILQNDFIVFVEYTYHIQALAQTGDIDFSIYNLALKLTIIIRIQR